MESGACWAMRAAESPGRLVTVVGVAGRNSGCCGPGEGDTSPSRGACRTTIFTTPELFTAEDGTANTKAEIRHCRLTSAALVVAVTATAGHFISCQPKVVVEGKGGAQKVGLNKEEIVKKVGNASGDSRRPEKGKIMIAHKQVLKNALKVG